MRCMGRWSIGVNGNLVFIYFDFKSVKGAYFVQIISKLRTGLDCFIDNKIHRGL